MSFDDIRSASVIRYPYLWARESDRGETEGRKQRPVAVAFRLVRDKGGDGLILLAITSQKPAQGRACVEIPASERLRAGLDRDKRLWIILDESNEDVIGKSFHLQPKAVIGKFGRAFFIMLIEAFLAQKSKTRRVNRNL